MSIGYSDIWVGGGVDQGWVGIGYSDIWVGGGVDQGWVGTVLPKVLLRWMPLRLSSLVVVAVGAAAAADDDDYDDDDGFGGDDDDDDDNAAAAADDDDDDDGGGGGDDDNDDNDNDDNYDDDDDAFLGLTHYTCSARSPVNGQNFDRRLLSTILDSGTRPYMPGKRAASRVERAIILLTALKPDRMGAERALLLNKEQRRPFVLSQSDQRSDFLRNTHHQLNGKNPSRYLSGSRPLKETALRAGPRWLHPS